MLSVTFLCLTSLCYGQRNIVIIPTFGVNTIKIPVEERIDKYTILNTNHQGYLSYIAGVNARLHFENFFLKSGLIYGQYKDYYLVTNNQPSGIPGDFVAFGGNIHIGSVNLPLEIGKEFFNRVRVSAGPQLMYNNFYKPFKLSAYYTIGQLIQDSPGKWITTFNFNAELYYKRFGLMGSIQKTIPHLSKEIKFEGIKYPFRQNATIFVISLGYDLFSKNFNQP